ncbi:MAG: PAS domain S-box protein [Phycisphaerales bacterium]|nr:PAS domain S-box protein [Phycisphaerales bacterium]
MRHQPGDSGPRISRAIVGIAGGYALLGGVSSFLGYVLDIQRLTDWVNSGVSIQPNAALCVTLSGFALLLLAAGEAWRKPTAALGALVGLIGGATVIEWVTDISFGIDGLLLFGREWGRVGVVVPGRMGPPGSTCWTLIGAALLLTAIPPSRIHWRGLAPNLAVGTVLISALSLIGYAYGVDTLYTLPRVTVIALQTSTFILAVSLGILASHPDREPLRTLVDPGAAGALARRIVPTVIIATVGFGFLRLKGQDFGWYDGPMGTALLVLTLSVVLMALLWWSFSVVRRHERALRESEARLRGFFEQIPLGVGVMDRDGKWLLSNSIMDTYVPHAIPSVLPERGVRWQAWDERGNPLPPADWPGKRALRGETVVPGLEMRYTHDDGRESWMRVSAAPLHNAPGEIIGATCVVEDIDQQARADAERKQLLESERAARMELERLARVKSEFLATVSHELRSPLNAIAGWAQLLRRTATAESIAEACKMIDASVRAQARIIDDLLDLQRAEAGKLRLQMQDVDLNDVIGAAVASVQENAEKKAINLRSEVPTNIGSIKGDGVRLQQVVWNLLANAVKFTPANGSVRLKVQRAADHVRITVSDTGHGIQPEFVSSMFERFLQADSSVARRHGGLGLGLAIVKSIVNLHGGSVWAESEGLERGAVFHVHLPVAAFAEPDGASELDNEPELIDARVLLVDDDVGACEVTARILRAAGAEVMVANSGVAGLVSAVQL